MEDDYSDILGSGVLNVKPQSSLPFGVKAGLWICTLVLLYIIGTTAWKNFLRWRELSYRLAMRRRHGIPDDDHRPFNVAYAAVQHAREKREALRRSKSRPMSNTAREQPPSSAQLKQDLRQRPGPTRNVEATWTKDRAESLPKGYRHSTTAGPSRYNPVNNGQQPVLQNEEKVLYPRATELVTSANHSTAASVRISKIQSDSRRRNYAYMDIDQGSLVANRLSSDAEPLERATFKRGSKREYGDAEETEDVLESKRAREKRARKVSLEKAILNEDMEVDENEFEDENADYGQASRGKKRDREEAGSTFGGDDEDRSEPEEAEDDTTMRRRSRKRRSVAKRKSDLATITRGKKRDRDIDEETSDEGSDRSYTQTSARKRRNKKEGIPDEEEDISMEESPAKGKGRKIGEEWTSNGVLYKIGPNGQRLRQALVKKARQKYHMPQDSQHPDRDANLEVYVETWLNEEGYQDAKTRHLLAWQDTPKASVERDTHEVKAAQPPPSPVGKSLLWKSTATPPATTPDGGSPTSELSGSAYPTTKGRISYDPRRQSIAVDVATRVNPFHQYPAQASKRIASGNARASSVGLVDSTNSSPRTGHRMYSKWEKQDLEANAMMKMREVARKKENEEKERLERERQEKERAEREKVEKDKITMPSVPIITVTEPAEDKPAGTGIPTFFAKPAVPAKDTANSPVAILSPVSLPGSAKSGEKTATPTESQPSLSPSATPFTFAVPGSSPFAPGAKPTVDSTKPSEQPRPPPFAPPQPSNVTSTSNPVPATSTPSFFSFSKPSAVPEPKKPEQNEQASGPSLLSRLGPGATPAASLQPSTFPFTKPAEAPKSFFSMPTTASSLTAPPSASTSMTTSHGAAGSPASKFDFKAPNKPSIATADTPASTAPDASKPGSSASIFSFKPTAAPSADSNAGAGGPPQFKFVFGTNPPTAKDAGGTTDNGAQGSKQTLTFSGFGAPASKPAPSVFSNAGAVGDRTSQPGFGTTGTPSDKSGPSSFAAKFETTAPSGSTMSGANTTLGFSASSNTQNSSSMPDPSSKPPAFGSFVPPSGTAGFGTSGALGGTPNFNVPKPTDGTNSSFIFGKTSTAPLPMPTTMSPDASTVSNHHSTFAFNDTSKAQSPFNAPSTSTNFSIPVNRTPLNKAGASEGAATAFSVPPNPFQTASGSGVSTTNPTAAVFGAGGSGQPASSSTSSSLFGALGSSGQSASNTTASSVPSGANAASTLGAPSSLSIFGSASNSTSTPTSFAVPPTQLAFPTTNTSQSSFGAPSGHLVPNSAPATTPSVFGGPSIFGNTKPGTTSTTLPFGVFGNTSQSKPQNSASAIQFGQTSMGTPNNTGGQS